MSPEPLAERIARHVARPDRGSFDELANALFAQLHERHAAFRELCDRAGVSPGNAAGWRAIPVASPSPESGGRAGEPDAALERDAEERAFRSGCLAELESPPILRLVAGGETPAERRLEGLCARLAERFGAPGSAAAGGGGRVDTVAARSWLAGRQRDRRPAAVLTTGPALERLLAAFERQDLRFQLAHGSRIVLMAGLDVRRAAGRSAERLGLARGGLLGRMAWPSVPTPLFGRVADDGGLAGALPSPWTRIRALHPETLEELPDGSPGRLSVLDLTIRGRPFHLLTPSTGVVERGLVRVRVRRSG